MNFVLRGKFALERSSSINQIFSAPMFAELTMWCHPKASWEFDRRAFSTNGCLAELWRINCQLAQCAHAQRSVGNIFQKSFICQLLISANSAEMSSVVQRKNAAKQSETVAASGGVEGGKPDKSQWAPSKLLSEKFDSFIFSTIQKI